MPWMTREDAFQLVWATPISTLADQFETTSAILRRSILTAGIPLPSASHRARARAGKSTAAASLPPREPGGPWRVWLGPHQPWYRHSDPAAMLAEPEPFMPEFSESLEDLRNRVREKMGHVRAIKGLEKTHPSIARYLDVDDQLRRARRSAVYSYYGKDPLFDSAFEKRRFRILNSLFQGLQKAGALPAVSGETAREMSVKVGDSAVTILLDHPDAKRDRQGQWRVREGWADLLKLRIEGGPEPREWADAEETVLEDHLTDICVAVIVAGEANYRNQALAQHQRDMDSREEARVELARHAAEAERKAREAQIARMRERRAELLKLARAHEDARLVRAFVTDVAQAGAPDGEDAFEKWRAWALNVADELDPAIHGDPPFSDFCDPLGST